MKKATILLFISVYIISSCSERTQKEKNPVKKIEKNTEFTEKIDTPYDRKFNDLATYLSGIQGDDSSSFKDLETSVHWLDYRTKLDAIWKKTNDKLPVMKAWSKKELTDLYSTNGTLLYPFSGPDFLHADIFFPSYDNYIMIGLEPIGTVPDLLAKSADSTGEMYLNGVRRSLYAILQLSFFRTLAMEDDFNSEVDGTLPVLLQFLNRTGNEVLYIEKVGVTLKGELTNKSSELTDSSYYGNRYYFKANGSDKVKTLTYFSVNLQNTAYDNGAGFIAQGLEVRKDFVAFLNNSDITATYLKSASYLMHRPSFSIIRNIILNQSKYLLQDDSGIPVKFFDRDKWDLSFYGTYTSPISLFSSRAQTDLREIYRSDSIIKKDLPFGIGYQYRQGTSNLMKAVKKK